jgi:hypothetical protein
MNHRPKPCAQCPWVKTTPPGQFPAERYEELKATTGSPGCEVGIGAPVFGCHKSAPGKELPCAGWLAGVGWHHMGIRIAERLLHRGLPRLQDADDRDAGLPVPVVRARRDDRRDRHHATTTR